VVTLTASPNSGYNFAYWSGDASGSGNPTTVTMNGSRSVVANFSQVCYSLSKNVSPGGGGNIGVNPTPNCDNGAKYTVGSVVQLMANASSGYSFVNWGGDASGSGNPTSITMNGNKAVTAYFVVCTTCGLANSTWPMYRHDLLHTGRSPNNGPTQPALKWSYVGDGAGSAPAIGANGAIYAGMGNKLVSLSQNGTLNWSYQAGGLVHAPLIAADGTIYVGSDDSKLYAVTSGGSLRWTYSTGDRINASPALGADGTIYIGSFDGYLYAINPNGSRKWRYQAGSWINPSPAIGTDGTIYFGSSNTRVYALNPDGTLKWDFTTGSYVDASPAIGADGAIYVGSWDKSLYALNPNGSLKWKYTMGDAIGFSSAAIGADGTIYVGSYDKKLYAIRPDGTLKWSYTAGDVIVSSPAIGSDGVIYVGAQDGKLYALNPNGSLKWNHFLGDALEFGPVIGSNGVIYNASRRGPTLYAVGEATASCLAESAHPYRSNTDQTWTLTNPDPSATQTRIHFSRLETEAGADYVYVLDGNNRRVNTFDGVRSDVWSNAISGRTVRVQLVTDGSSTAWGFCVDRIETVGGGGTPPAAPTNLRAAATDSTHIRLDWTDASNNESGFKVKDSAGNVIATVGAGVTTATIGGLTPGVNYCYRVLAYNSNGNSADAGPACATTPANPQTCTPGANGVVLYEHPNYGGRCVTLTGDVPDLDSYSFNDMASAIRFVGSYASGWEAVLYDNPNYLGATSTFRGDDPDFGNDSINHDTTSSIVIRQIPAAGCLAESAHNYRSNTDQTWTLTNPDPNATQTRIHFSRLETEAGADYVYVLDGNNRRVNTFDGVRSDVWSNAVSGRMVRVQLVTDGSSTAWGFCVDRIETVGGSGTAPAAPGNLRAAATDSTHVRLDWNDASNNESGFKVKDSAGNIVATVGAGVTTATIGGLTPGVNYCYRVLAYNSNGNSADAGPACATTPGDPDDGRTIASGQTLYGTIDPVGDEDTYYFDAAQGQKATIRMDRTDSSLDCYLTLYAPDGTEVTRDDDSGDGTNALINQVTLSQNGRYRIVARSCCSYNSGPYSLALTLEGQSACTPGANGVVLYELPNYGGRCITFTADDADFNNDNFNDLASSIRFVGSYASGWEVVLYEHTQYYGVSSTFRASDPDLSNDTVGDNRASSIRIRQIQPACVAESEHNYRSNTDYTWTLTNPDPNATQTRIHFSRLETEAGYDFVYVLDGSNRQVNVFDGLRSDLWSNAVTGRTVRIRLVSDGSTTAWGFCVDRIETVASNSASQAPEGARPAHTTYLPILTR
jgi:outer membrane protein assembly factor BamB